MAECRRGGWEAGRGWDHRAWWWAGRFSARPRPLRWTVSAMLGLGETGADREGLVLGIRIREVGSHWRVEVDIAQLQANVQGDAGGLGWGVEALDALGAAGALRCGELERPRDRRGPKVDAASARPELAKFCVTTIGQSRFRRSEARWAGEEVGDAHWRKWRALKGTRKH